MEEDGGVPAAPDPDVLFGRDDALARVGAAIDRAVLGERAVVLVGGSAGMGKTSLVRAALHAATDPPAALDRGRGPLLAAWGVAVDGGAAPGYWPWTQVLGRLVRAVGPARARELAGDDAPRLATIAEGFGPAGDVEGSDRERLLLIDAAARWLAALATEQPVVVVLDDLQWADGSSLALLDFVARTPDRAGLCVVAAYRPDELGHPARDRMAALASAADHVHLRGLDRLSSRALIERTLGHPVDDEEAEAVHRRAGGHPLFVRELALARSGRAMEPGGDQPLPVAIRETIERRLRALTDPTRRVLQVAAMAGNVLLPDVVAGALRVEPTEVAVAVEEATEAGILAVGPDGRDRFVHDLFRETTIATVPAADRATMHQAIGEALAVRRTRAGDVGPAELARHFAAAVAVDGTERAVEWALVAAGVERSALAFTEAAAHLRRLRGAAADAGRTIPDPLLVEVLLAEADANARAGNALEARGLLRVALDLGTRRDEPLWMARAALATTQLGARFSSRRDEVLADLTGALDAIRGGDHLAVEAQLTAALARELQHSVAADRPRSHALSEQALALGRRAGDDATLHVCLLARHDVLWTPGQEEARAEVAEEVVALARRSGDAEHEAEGLLLLANAQLEHGSAAFEVTLQTCLAILDRLGQPRHRYTAETRRGCLALLSGWLDEAADRIEGAAELGERIREPDAGNVRMSQRLELVRARSDPTELIGFAGEAIVHWTGAPVHAHAVAAGFCARAGELAQARRHVATVEALGGWRADSSYLSSVFVRELGQAAAALGDDGLCADLLAAVRPHAGSCGVNGAVVAFAGSYAHTAGLLAAALADHDDARALLEQARATYARLGAAAEAEVDEALAGLAGRGRSDAGGAAPATASMRRDGGLWHVAFHEERAAVPASKGLADIARLVGQPGVEVHVLDLMGSADRSGTAGPVVDRQALASYRARLAELDGEADEAARHHDLDRELRVAHERDDLLAELARVLDGEGQARPFANTPSERARKAVAGRIRDAIRRLEPALPELAAHLDRTIVTGQFCRYRADGAEAWVIEG